MQTNGSLLNGQIRNVAVAGATGQLGKLVIESLVQSGRFTVTILARTEPTDTIAGVKVSVVDYYDDESLQKALTGQDAVVCTLSRDATKLQIPLINAAVAVGVKRFIPSEFGGDLQNPNLRQLINYTNKVRVEDYLEAKCKSHDLTYTYIYNNVFMDWSIETGITLNPKQGKIHLYDGGERPVSMIRMPAAAQAVVGVLTHFEETKNRPVRVHEACMSQKQLLAYAKEAMPDQEWKVVRVSVDELERQAKEQAKLGVPNMSIFHAFAVKGGFGDGFGNQFSEADNLLLGIEPISVESIKNMIVDIAKK